MISLWHNRIPIALVLLFAFLTFNFVLGFADATQAQSRFQPIGSLDRDDEPTKDNIEILVPGIDKAQPQQQQQKKGFLQGLVEGIGSFTTSVFNFLKPVIDLLGGFMILWAVWEGLKFIWDFIKPPLDKLLVKLGWKKPEPIIQPMNEVIKDDIQRYAYLKKAADNKEIIGPHLDLTDPTGVYRVKVAEGQYDLYTEAAVCKTFNYGDSCANLARKGINLDSNENQSQLPPEHDVKFEAITQNLIKNQTHVLDYRYIVSKYAGGPVIAQGRGSVSIDWNMITEMNLFGCNVGLEFKELEYKVNGNTYSRPGVIYVPRIVSGVGTQLGINPADVTDCLQFTTAQSTDAAGPTSNSQGVTRLPDNEMVNALREAHQNNANGNSVNENNGTNTRTGTPGTGSGTGGTGGDTGTYGSGNVGERSNPNSGNVGGNSGNSGSPRGSAGGNSSPSTLEGKEEITKTFSPNNGGTTVHVSLAVTNNTHSHGPVNGRIAKLYYKVINNDIVVKEFVVGGVLYQVTISGPRSASKLSTEIGKDLSFKHVLFANQLLGFLDIGYGIFTEIPVGQQVFVPLKTLTDNESDWEEFTKESNIVIRGMD